MSHKRTLIADAILKRIKGKTDAGQNVAYSYTPKPSMTQLPIVLIYAQSEDVEELSQAPRELRRNLFLSVEATADGSDDAEMTIRLDNLADQIEQLLSQDDSLGGIVDDIIMNSIQFQYEGEETESPAGSCRMVYLVRYRTFVPREQVDVDDFNSINADWDISPEGEPDSNIEANDIIKFDE